MKLQTITLELEGKSNGDIESALAEAIRLIKEGNLAGSDENDTGGFSFNIDRRVKLIDAEKISAEAKHIASQFELKLAEKDGSANSVEVDFALSDFALSREGLDLDEFNEYIKGDVASMIQVMIDEMGGLDNDGEGEVISELNDFFEFDEPIVALSDMPSDVPA